MKATTRTLFHYDIAKKTVSDILMPRRLTTLSTITINTKEVAVAVEEADGLINPNKTRLSFYRSKRKIPNHNRLHQQSQAPPLLHLQVLRQQLKRLRPAPVLVLSIAQLLLRLSQHLLSLVLLPKLALRLQNNKGSKGNNHNNAKAEVIEEVVIDRKEEVAMPT